MTDAKRTLAITATFQDQASAKFAALGKAVSGFAKAGAADLIGFAKSVFSLHTGFGILGAGLIARFAGQTANQVVEAAAALERLQKSVGGTVEQLSVLQATFELESVSADQFTLIMKGLERVLAGTAGTAGSNAARGLQQIGLSVSQLRSLDPFEVFAKIAGGLEKYNTQQEKAQVLAKIFPRNFQALLPVLGQGEVEFRRLAAIAEEFGGKLSGGAAVAAEHFEQSMVLLELSMRAVGRTAFIELAQKFTPIIQEVARFVALNADKIGKGLAAVTEAVIDLAAGFGILVLRGIQLALEWGAKLAKLLESLGLLSKSTSQSLAGLFEPLATTAQGEAILKQLKDVVAQAKLADEELAKMRTARARGEGQHTERGFELAPTEGAQAAAEALHTQAEDLAAAFAHLEGIGNEAEVAQNALAAASRSTSLEAFAKLIDGLVSSLRGLQGKGIDTFSRVGDAAKEAAKQAEGPWDAFWRGFSDGADKAKTDLLDFAKQGEKAASTLINHGIDGLSGAFADFVTHAKSAKDAFRDFAKESLHLIIQLIVKMLALRLIASFFGGGAAPTPAPDESAFFAAKGGVVGPQGSMPLRRYGGGGIANRPQMAIFGEGSKPEAYVPLPDGRSIPVSWANGGPGGGSSVVINIQAWDGADVARVLTKHQSLLWGLIENQSQRMPQVRQVIRRAGS